MAFLSHNWIDQMHPEIFGSPKEFDPGRLQGSSYELTLGDEVFLSSEKKLVNLGNHRFDIKIQPGDFAILLTHETVRIPRSIMGFISIKTSFKNMGLVNISGFHVDPGWIGRLTFSVYNAGPGEIMLRFREPLFLIFFAALDKPVEERYIYNGVHKNQQQIRSSDMNTLTGKPVSPAELDSRLRKLEYTTTIQWGLLAALTIAVLVATFKALY